jgi:transposase-like protein
MSGPQKPLVSVVGGVGAGLPERSEPERSGGRPAARVVPDPEVSVPARRRQFTAQEKASLLEEAKSCRASGTLGAFLRRHGLYSSHLAKWRQQRERAGLVGRSPTPGSPHDTCRSHAQTRPRSRC